MDVSRFFVRLSAVANIRRTILLLCALLISGPSMGQEEADFDGPWLYQQHCATCHGEEGGGFYPFGIPLAGNDFIRQAPIGAISAVIQNGVLGSSKSEPDYSGMPPFDYLRGGKVRELAAYLKEQLQE
ncbi:MAG: cytochrome c [Gammaproteobacteria bacterium]|nr:cytochrome c [Pseudomonadales bacterium]MCP5348616.1 cytochrome c [Pseudomonadales bacterium]